MGKTDSNYNTYKPVLTRVEPSSYIRAQIYAKLVGKPLFEIFNEALFEYLESKNAPHIELNK